MDAQQKLSQFINIVGTKNHIHERKGSPHLLLFLRLLQLWFRDVLVLKRTGNEAALIFKQEIKYINQYAEMLDFTGISGILEDIMTAFRRLSVKGNPQYILESVLLSVRDRFRKDKPAETPER